MVDKIEASKVSTVRGRVIADEDVWEGANVTKVVCSFATELVSVGFWWAVLMVVFVTLLAPLLASLLDTLLEKDAAILEMCASYWRFRNRYLKGWAWRSSFVTRRAWRVFSIYTTEILIADRIVLWVELEPTSWLPPVIPSLDTAVAKDAMLSKITTFWCFMLIYKNFC